jgi:hypothetical protein
MKENEILCYKEKLELLNRFSSFSTPKLKNFLVGIKNVLYFLKTSYKPKSDNVKDAKFS